MVYLICYILIVNYFDNITDQSVQHVMRVLTNIVSQVKGLKEICFMFSSNGGSVSAGITLYYFLKALPLKITMHNIGHIDSIATVVFLSGEKRIAAKGSRFIFHGVKSFSGGPTSRSLSELKEIKDGLEKDQNRISKIYAEETDLDAKEVQEMFNVGESKEPHFAKSKGIISDVLDPSIPPGCQIIYLDGQQQIQQQTGRQIVFPRGPIGKNKK